MAASDDSLSVDTQLEKRAPGRPSAFGYQFYRSTSNLFQWAVLGVSTPELRTGDLRFDFASTSAVLVAETRTHCVRAGFTVGNAASNAKWTAVHDSLSNTIGIVVDATQASISALEWAQLQQYLEQWFQAQGVGFGTQMTDDVVGLIHAPVKRSSEVKMDLARRQDYCSVETLSALDSIVDVIASLPTDSLAC